MKQHKWLLILILVLLAALFTPMRVRADMAPPQQPPGTNIVPGSENTQVRMVAETVKLIVLTRPSEDFLGQAATEAVFTMRNLGTKTETMEARFPLTFWNNESDGYLQYPEIADIRVLVNDKLKPTHRINVEYTPTSGTPYHPTPWAAFTVTFPPGEDVVVTVKYTSSGGDAKNLSNADPYFPLRYILETGAGWNGTIGSADIIVKLPYAANSKNVLLNSAYNTAETSANAKFVGDEIRWHYDNFEPTADHNIQITLVKVATWQKVLEQSAYLQTHPNDGEAWGQLARAYKDIVLPALNKGYPRVDSLDSNAPVDRDGREMYQLGIQAYEQAVKFLPDDAQWHYGFADLLARHLHWRNFDTANAQDISELVRALDQLRQSIQLDSANQNAKDLASELSSTYPWAIIRTDSGYDYPLLTATPTANPTVPLPQPLSTPQPPNAPKRTALPAAATDAPPGPTQTPKAGLPLCGGAGLIVLPALGLFWRAAKKKRATHW